MNVLGLDVGFSITKATNSFCLLNVDAERKEIGLVEGAERFFRGEAPELFGRLSRSYPEIRWVSVDAPLTPLRLTLRPKSGRSVDKRFSKGVFHSSRRGPQPGSISVPLQGWPLYEAGMDIVESLREAMLGNLVGFADFAKEPSAGVIECIPKLTQALLVPLETVRERRGTVDDYLFPLLFDKEGPFRSVLDRALGDYGFSAQVEALISGISSAPRRHHEELAAVVAAVQGALVAIGRASVVGRDGDSEGYYALPHRGDWNRDWSLAFESTRASDANGVDVIDLGARRSLESPEAEPAVPRPNTAYGRLVDELGRFVAERDWEQFHSPKNLAMALSVEVAEIVEHFQWLTEEQSRNLPPEKLAEVRQEIGDVMIYLAELADKLGIEPLEAARAKIDVNKSKYPATLVRGRADKYTEYHRIERFVESVTGARIRGQLHLRDGLSFLELTGDLAVEGSLIRYFPDLTEGAYAAIAELEPGNLYKWEACDVWAQGSTVRANALVGRSPQAGRNEFLDEEDWHVADDPLFNEALEEIESIVTEPPPQDPTDLRAYFRKQMAYLLLWNSIERYVSLRWGFGGGPTARVKRLAEEQAFREALARYVGERREVRSTADPTNKEVLDKSDPRRAIKYYHQLRSNMVQRGKSAIGERQIVEQSIEELLKIYKHVLDVTLRGSPVS